jgi:shikimate dehydrogenase
MSQDRILVGLIGANILKSLSPALHEDACQAAGRKGHYHLIDIDVLQTKRLAELLAGVRALGFTGTNVTYPFKEAVLPLLDEVAAEARQIGAVNTVCIDAQGRTTGHNTDRIGFRRSFEEGLGREAVAGKSAVLVGAGGAGRAVGFALMDLGAGCVLVHDQDKAKAAALIADLMQHFGAERCRMIDDPAAAIPAAAGVVNATPLGMHGIPGDPVPLGPVTAAHWVADVIYTPLETQLIKRARAKGARVLTGGGMCVHQAAESFRLFTGLVADVPRMHRLFAGLVTKRDAALAS